MQFHSKNKPGSFSSIGKFLIRIIIIILILLISVVVIDKIEFPYPNKKIEKKIPNENFKIVK